MRTIYIRGAGWAALPVVVMPSVLCSLRVVESDQVSEGHLVDALALRGDEGRDRLR